jgi:cytochrome c556
MRKLLLTGLFTVFALAAGAPAQAQSADAVIAARKAGMDLAAAATGAAKRAVDAKEDVKALKNVGEGLAAWGKAMPGLFSPGSDKGDTKALPAVFSDHDGFVKAGMALNAAGLKLAAAAEANDKAAFAAAFGEVGAACGGCHRTYRAR